MKTMSVLIVGAILLALASIASAGSIVTIDWRGSADIPASTNTGVADPPAYLAIVDMGAYERSL
jgi:hypothetical protein